jgi:hypothetical protein
MICSAATAAVLQARGTRLGRGAGERSFAVFFFCLCSAATGCRWLRVLQARATRLGRGAGERVLVLAQNPQENNALNCANVTGLASNQSVRPFRPVTAGGAAGGGCGRDPLAGVRLALAAAHWPNCGRCTSEVPPSFGRAALSLLVASLPFPRRLPSSHCLFASPFLHVHLYLHVTFVAVSSVN